MKLFQTETRFIMEYRPGFMEFLALDINNLLIF